MRKTKTGVIIAAAGVLLIICAAALLINSIVTGSNAERRNEEAVDKILSLIPERKDGVLGDRTDPNMPIMQIDGHDYICLLETGSDNCLPVLGTKSTGGTPYRYSGTVAERSLIIGGFPSELFALIQANEIAVVTDMLGRRYTYALKSVVTADEISEALDSDETDLVLFTSNRWKSGYSVLLFELAK